MSPRCLSGTYPRRPISTSLRRLLYVPNETPNNVAVIRFHHISELRCRDVLLVSLYYFFKLLCHNLHLVGFHVSFKCQIKTPNFSSTNQEGSKSSLDCKLAELLLHLTTATCINNGGNIYCVDIHISW